MKRRAAYYAMLLSFCVCFFFSTAKTNTITATHSCCGHATNRDCPASLSEKLEISIIHYVLLNI